MTIVLLYTDMPYKTIFKEQKPQRIIHKHHF